MHDKQELCNKIVEMYPEIGQCEIDILVDWDDKKNVWVVDLKKDEHELQHYLEELDADHCMDNKECVSLGLEIAQLVNNINGEQF
ncbi:MAG: hypothetical protein GQ559_00600 [Desulfobulbaceae bacterium]|nr:hypothetical protein [Desulfobulbaceae bacterium]